MRKVVTRLIVGLICAGLCAWGLIWHNHSEVQQQHDVARQQVEAVATFLAKLKQPKQSVARMVSAHNAVGDWTEAFSGKRFAERLASEELAPALARRDGRPVLVFGSVVDVITQNDGCKLEVDAKANLVSNLRLWLTCTPAQVKEAISLREEAREEALEEIRGETGEPGEETPKQRQDDDREAERRARQGYALIARVDSVHSEEAETTDDPPAKAQFTIAEGRCLELLYVGRDYSPDSDETYLRLNASEDERRARREMEIRAIVHKALEAAKKGDH